MKKETIEGLTSVGTGLFGLLSSYQTVKAEQIKLQALEKQKGLLEQQQDSEVLATIKAQIENQKQAIAKAESDAKKQTTIQIAIVVLAVILLIFIGYQVSKRI